MMIDQHCSAAEYLVSTPSEVAASLNGCPGGLIDSTSNACHTTESNSTPRFPEADPSQ
jgi:hypothetical protein